MVKKSIKTKKSPLKRMKDETEESLATPSPAKPSKRQKKPPTFDDFLETLDEFEGNGDEANEEMENSEEEEEEEETSLKSHKRSMQSLEQSDPEFFAFLKENDAELLNFDDDESDEDSELDDEEEKVHKPNEDLEVASDSEAEEEIVKEKSLKHKDEDKIKNLIQKRKVNLEVINEWESRLKTTRDLNDFSNVIEAFDCGVKALVNTDGSVGLKWKIDGSTNYNALVRICLRNVKGFCVRFLLSSNNLEFCEKKFDEKPYEVLEKNKQKWTKLRPKIRTYMKALISFLKSMSNPEAISSVLRHCTKMAGIWALMGSKSYKFLKAIMNIWAQGEDSCRILAFMTILRMANYNKEIFLTRCFKQMYIMYVANCKFTSVNTWPSINFMRTSLVEIYLLDTGMSYAVAFPFIRQLAIHLRNAVTAGSTQVEQAQKNNKKETSRIVYSWQFLHSLHLWTDLLAQASSYRDENLKLLIYPIVQIALGTIKLIPTKKYLPLRFHIIKMLTRLQEKTHVFIPILPLAVEVFNFIDFSSKSVSKFSVRPLDMTCCLKADSREGGFAKGVSENVFNSVLGACRIISTEISFPEVICPSLIALKNFLKKKCKNPEVGRKFKTLIEKIEANSKFIKEKRAKALEERTISLQDPKTHQIFRVQMENCKPPAPLVAFATDYFKVNVKESAKQRKKHIETKEEKLIPKFSATNNASRKRKSEGSVPLFAHESDSDNEDNFNTKLEEETPETSKKGKKKKLQPEVENEKKKKKKVKGKKSSSKTIINKFGGDDMGHDIQDELVDFELSD